MDKSDIYVISNSNSYEGYMVSIEFGYATYSILHSSSSLRKIYFTNIPLGYDKFNSDIDLSFDTFLENLYKNPSYQNELAFFIKHSNNKNNVFQYTSERSFYDDLKDMYGKVLLLQSRGNLIIGLEDLLVKNKNEIPAKQHPIPDDYEYEL